MYENIAKIRVDNRLKEGVKSQYAARHQKINQFPKAMLTRIISMIIAIFS
jgi:hypothetical protein